MDEPEHGATPTIVTDTIVVVLIGWFSFVAYLLALVFGQMFLGPLGVLIAAVGICHLVRRLNRRDDPRYTKPPPDPP